MLCHGTAGSSGPGLAARSRREEQDVPRLSAGLLIYRISEERGVEVLVVHPGGPFWAKKDVGAWSIPKGEHETTEDPRQAATREFEEELGSEPPAGDWFDLGEVRQSGGKVVHVWALSGEFDTTTAHSNVFTLEWPPHSGVLRDFPEVDRISWESISSARSKLNKGQVPFLDRLVDHLA